MRDDVAILLEWFVANGIGELFNDSPCQDALEESGRQSGGNLGSVILALAKQQQSIKDLSGYSVRGIREVVDRAGSLEELVALANQLEAYGDLRKMASSTVLLGGKRDSEIMLINDLPNDEDDLNGSIFSGQTGELAGKMFSSIDLDLENLCLANSFFWRLPGNRAPIREELDICKPILERIVGFVKPRLIIFCGNYGLSTLLGQNRTITALRGKFLSYSNCYMQSSVTVTGTYGPSFLLRNGGKKKDAWADLLKIRVFLEETHGSRPSTEAGG
ncbi:MAG: uracil-DNA glycosylase [Rickettsiales bacterium]|nr:uracil-DNA glycosylase [Rickettsiales bacterium]